MQRDLFDHLLGIALENKIGLEKTLSYPLTLILFSVSHWTICKTDKSALLKCLEKEIKSEELTYTDIAFLDVFFCCIAWRKFQLRLVRFHRKF